MQSGYTDLHCHILPGIDDGARNVGVSLELLRAEAAAGVRRIALTPHFNFERQNLGAFLQNRHDAAVRLAEQFRAAGLPVRLKLGAEVYFSPQLLDCDVKRLCLQGTPYLLVEFPTTYYPEWADDVFYRLSLEGIRPLVAHVERYPYILREPNLLLDLIEAGAFIQVNATSLVLHRQAKNLILRLVRHGLVHVVASDTHSMTKRPPLLGEAMALVRQKCGGEAAARLEQNAGAVFAGRALHAPDPAPMKPLLGHWL